MNQRSLSRRFMNRHTTHPVGEHPACSRSRDSHNPDGPRVRPYRPFIAITLLVLAFLALPPSNPQATHAQTEQVYLALGDSIAAGLLASLPSERGYPALLHQLIETEQMASGTPAGIELVNLAVPGETVESFLNNGQLDSAIETIENTPTGNLRTVTITIGGNNILALWEASAEERETELQNFQGDFSEAMEQLADALEGHDADVIVTTYYDLTEGDPDAEGSNAWWLRQFNEAITDVSIDVGFQVVDLEEAFRGRISELTWFPADIHPNNSGHELIARTIWQQLGYDQEPPEVSITRPDAGETRNRVPTIHATVEDAIGIESVILQVDGDDQHELIYVPAYDSWIGLWDGRNYAGTQAELTVVARDISGNEANDTVTISLPTR